MKKIPTTYDNIKKFKKTKREITSNIISINKDYPKTSPEIIAASKTSMSRNSSILPAVNSMKDSSAQTVMASQRSTKVLDLRGGAMDWSKGNIDLLARGAAAPSDPILAYLPYNIWDSEHVVIDGTSTTLLDYNTVGVAYDMVNPASSNQPTFNSSSAAFNGLPSFTFDGVSEYVTNNVSGYRDTDESGIVISVYKLVSGTNLHLFTSADSTNNMYLINQIVSATKFRLATEDNDIFNVHFGTDDITGTDSRVYSFGSNGTVHKFFNNESIDVVSATPEAGQWFADVDSRDNISIGGQVRASPAYSNIEWCFCGYFPFVSDDTTVEIINILKTRYGIS
tara:strand:- start:11957 stop:12970 length:1014 start_codon:yes stop_codon:yes gene_type:complete